jgi:hypothetical protein
MYKVLGFLSDSDDCQSENTEEFHMLDGKKSFHFKAPRNVKNKFHACLFCEKLKCQILLVALSEYTSKKLKY